MKRIALLLTGLAAAVVLSGCGPDRPETIHVRGTVTFDGAAPPAEGMVYFAPVRAAEGFSRRPGQARFDTGGAFDVTSFGKGDGLVPGTYLVRVECWKTPPSMDNPGAGESYVAGDYEPETIEVSAESGTMDLTLDVPLAK